jgi:methylmalonyl-CoA/ethylmalonyl-CoA epimerase
VKLNHIGIVVSDLEGGKGFWKEALGLASRGQEEVPSEKVRTAFYQASKGVNVELLEAMGEDSPVAGFLAKRGPGIHHLCFEVEDLDAALAKAEAAGCCRIKDPGPGAHHSRVVFLHPKTTGGILIELAEK